ARGEALAVGGVGHALHFFLMPGEVEGLDVRDDAPDLDRAVGRARGDEFPVGTIGHADNGGRVSAQSEQLAAVTRKADAHNVRRAEDGDLPEVLPPGDRRLRAVATKHVAKLVGLWCPKGQYALGALKDQVPVAGQ